MARVFHASGVQEAVELATRFKADGTYDWFRGQVRDWPPRSSLARLRRMGDHEAIDLAERRLNLFVSWIEGNPALKYLTKDENVDQLFAIAQHYGIPTNYIDFTTSPAVAGFFAADTPAVPSEGLSCIYCLNTKDMMDLVGAILKMPSRKGAMLETISIEVSNLWRLQAQHGVFLFANYNWELDYDLDKIVFPYSGYPSYPSRAVIYPREKSQLEILLDQYFDIETQHFGSKQMRKMIEDIRREGGDVGLFEMDAPEDGIDPDALAPGVNAVPLESWKGASLEAWHKYSDEHFRTVRTGTQQIHIDSDHPDSVPRAVAYGVGHILNDSPGIRAELVEWRLVGNVANLPVTKLSDAFRAAWNGMRHLPFSNADVASAFSTIAALMLSGMEVSGNHRANESFFSSVRGPSVRVEFANVDGSYSRGYANCDDLRSAMRADLDRIINPEVRGAIADVRNILLLIYNPAVLFEFDPFVAIFARDLIPSQLMLDRKATLFNPATITRFGLP